MVLALVLDLALGIKRMSEDGGKTMNKDTEKWSKVASKVSYIQTDLLETQQRLIKLMPEKEKQISEAAEKLMQILKEETEKL